MNEIDNRKFSFLYIPYYVYIPPEIRRNTNYFNEVEVKY